MVFAERLTHFVENNERLLDFKVGSNLNDEGRGGFRREGDFSAPRSFGRRR
jgi:hypothetical protein